MCRSQIHRIAVHRLYTISTRFSCWISTVIRNLCRDGPKVSKICICPANIYVSTHYIYPWMLAKPKESRKSIFPLYISSSSKTNFPPKTISNHSKLIYPPPHYQLCSGYDKPHRNLFPLFLFSSSFILMQLHSICGYHFWVPIRNKEELQLSWTVGSR